MTVPYHARYVVDACVYLAYLDPTEPYHKEAVDFFKDLDTFVREGKEVSVILPAHFVVEVNLNIEKKKNEAAKGTRGEYRSRISEEKINFIGYPLSMELMNKIEAKGLYEKIALKLRPGDFIYAAISYIESIPLVTLDKNDFSKIVSDVEVIFLY